MSFNSEHNTFCSCWRCQKTYNYIQKQIWVHRGIGRFDEKTFREYKSGTKLNINEIFEIPKFETYFKNLEEKNLIVADRKPIGCIWFSAGSWLYDSYCDGSHDEMVDIVNKRRIIMTSNPLNILRITTFEELNIFIEKYAIKYLDEETETRDKKIIKLLAHLINFVQDRDILFEQAELVLTKLGLNYDIILKFLHERCDIIVNFVPDFITQIKIYYPEFDAIISQNNYSPSENELSYMKLAGFESYVDYVFSNFHYLKQIYNFILLDKLKKQQNTYKYDGQIQWLNVYKDGYYGVSFEFRKVDHILPESEDFDIIDRKFFWHYGFDVESLCIFDLRAFTNLSIEDIEF
jgi:hypothetical protein